MFPVVRWGHGVPAASAFSAAVGSPIVGDLDTGVMYVFVNGVVMPINVANANGFGAEGDGSTDDHAAFEDFIGSVEGGVGYIPTPAVAYKIGAALTLPANTTLIGSNKQTCKILKAFNGDLFTMENGSGFSDLYLEGDGANYTGRLIVIGGTNGKQHLTRCRVENADSYCIEFTATTAGSQFYAESCSIFRYNGTAAGRHAVKIADASQLTAVPRHFIGIETGGNKFIDLGGCNNIYIQNSFLGDVLFSSNSRAAQISGCRYGANETAANLAGFNHTITGCDISPQITIAAGTGECAIQGCVFNNSTPIVDNSGLGGRNKFDIGLAEYTSALNAAHTLGDGTIRTLYSRAGGAVRLDLQFKYGSTTSLAASELRFTLPFASVNDGSGIEEILGTAFCYDDSLTTRHEVQASIPVGQAYCRLLLPGTGTATGTAPFTWALNDYARISLAYTA
jgi:hypothetical protein